MMMGPGSGLVGRHEAWGPGAGAAGSEGWFGKLQREGISLGEVRRGTMMCHGTVMLSWGVNIFVSW